MDRKIPCVFMRGGTSKGPFFDLRDLPADREARDAALLSVMGSPDPRQIDGLGGGTLVTSKAVLAQPSARDGYDVDYHLAQIFVDRPTIDHAPTCLNMMAGVGPFAIEKGWVEAVDPETTVRVFDVNTGATAEILVETPAGRVNYDRGDVELPGVPGTAAPVQLNLTGVAGAITGRLFPTGNRRDSIEGIDVSIVDAGNLMTLAGAAAFGLEGTEDVAFFDGNRELMGRLEAIRRRSGHLAGLGDVRDSVLPKIGLLSPPREGGAIRSQYFTPHTLHPSHAVSGALCIAVASKAAGTVASEAARVSADAREEVGIEHRAGTLPVRLEMAGEGGELTVARAGVLRTARKIMEGYAFY